MQLLPATLYPDRQPQVDVLLSAQNCSQFASTHRVPTQANCMTRITDLYNADKSGFICGLTA